MYLLDFINGKCLYDGVENIELSNAEVIYKTLNSMVLSDVFIINGPSHYTSTRTALAIGKALSIYGFNIYSFSMLDYLALFSSKVSFSQNQIVWIRQEREEKIIRKDLFEEKYKDSYIGNHNFNCNTNEIWIFLSNLKNKEGISQNYVDKFENFK